MSPLKTYLDDNRIKTVDFAKRLGVTPGRVSQLLGGAGTRPSLELAVLIEDETGINPRAWLADRKKRKHRS